MALTKSPLPTFPSTFDAPFDYLQAFSQGAFKSASGYLEDANGYCELGPGRFEGLLHLNIGALKLSSGDEFYRVLLLGSNDGGARIPQSCEPLAIWEAAAASSGRLLPTICAPTPAIPAAGANAGRIVRPFINQVGDYNLRWLYAYIIMGGTAPSFSASVWFSHNTIRADAARAREKAMAKPWADEWTGIVGGKAGKSGGGSRRR